MPLPNSRLAINRRSADLSAFLFKIVKADDDLLKGSTSVDRDQHVTSKAFAYVYFYGHLEFSLRIIISEVLLNLAGHNLRVRDLELKALPVALDSIMTSLTAAGPNKWKDRSEFFELIESSASVKFNPKCFDSYMQSVSPNALENICKAFGITEAAAVSGPDAGRIASIKRKRDDLAHGNETPIAIGQRASARELQNDQSAIQDQIQHLLKLFENFIDQQMYLKNFKYRALIPTSAV